MLLLLTLFLASGQTDFGVRTPSGSLAKPPQNRPNNGSRFSCRVSSVHDGDTFRCADGTRIRLSAIDAPEMPGACQPGRNCAAGDPYKAKAALAQMINGRTVQCQPAGRSYNRIAAWCSVNGQDLSCAMVSSGHAVRLARYDRQNEMCR